jgi:hypothetical protein
MANFGKHPSEELCKMYEEKPWQMQDPKKARIIFLGLDANFDENIAKTEFYKNYLLSYWKDGVFFWKGRIHHPFLLPEYKGAGKTYHRNFQKLQLDDKFAKDISFIELLNVPTFGKLKDINEFKKLIDVQYLKKVDELIAEPEKLVFIPKRLFLDKIFLSIKEKYELFNFDLKINYPKGELFFNVKNSNNNFIFVCNHLSASNHNWFYIKMGEIIKSFLYPETEKPSWEISYIYKNVSKLMTIKNKSIYEVKGELIRLHDKKIAETELKQLTFSPIEVKMEDK